MIRVEQVHSSDQIEKVKQLFWLYGISRGFDAALGNYKMEIDRLPFPYDPPDGSLLLGLWRGDAIACVAYKKLSPDICEMKRLYVLDRVRGKGIGRALVESLIQLATQHPYKLMRLDTHPHMHAAHKLYTQAGFYEIERYNENPIPGIRFFEKKLN